MNDIFREWLDDFVIVYINDILIYSSSMEEHAEHLERLREKQVVCEAREVRIWGDGSVLSWA
jgi:hypothetical protein